MHTYLACFDISDDKQRRYVSRRLAHFGVRVQYSVFEISLDNEKTLARLQQELLDRIEPGDDIRFYHLCLNCRVQSQDAEGQRVAQFPKAVIL